MSLFGSLQIAGTSLRASQIGLQVVGQNVANANTPGYIREEVVLAPAPVQQFGSLQLGLGVQVQGIIQRVDNLLEQRLRNATSDRASTDVEEQTFQQLESLVNELGGEGLGKSLADFIGSVNEVLNQPQDASTRNLTALRGQTLASDVNRLYNRAQQLKSDINQQIGASVADVNRLLTQIGDLNVKIAKTEGGNPLQSTAVGLRDQRLSALGQLAGLIDINVQEQKNGTVAVYVGGDFLVFGNEVRQVKLSRTAAGDELRLADTNSLLQPSSGKLLGLLNSRDVIVGGFEGDLDSLAKTLAFEFNKIHSSGQGLNGYSQLTSTEAIADASKPLDAAGLPSSPINGSFQLHRYNKTTGLTTTTDIRVDLNGLDQDSSLTDLVSQLNQVPDVWATVDASGRLTIKSLAAEQSLSFGNDSSGLLAALGLNTFFTGSSAATLGVNQEIIRDPLKFAASQGGVGADAANATRLANFLDSPLESQNGKTLSQIHADMIADVTQRSAETHSVAEGNRVFESSLQGESLATNGVNIDEETIRMLAYQRTFQVAAKFLSTVNDLLGVLIDL